MPNYVSQQSFYNRMQKNENPASIFGFDPEKYGQYFEPYENIKPELEFIRRQSELARQGIGLQKQGAEQSFQSQRQSGTSSLFDLIQQAQGLRGRSGFGAFGAAEKAMSSNADRLRKALESGVTQYGTQMGGYDLAGKQAGLAEERDIYGTKRSFYQDAIQSAIDVLQSGGKTEFADASVFRIPDSPYYITTTSMQDLLGNAWRGIISDWGSGEWARFMQQNAQYLAESEDEIRRRGFPTEP